MIRALAVTRSTFICLSAVISRRNTIAKRQILARTNACPGSDGHEATSNPRRNTSSTAPGPHGRDELLWPFALAPCTWTICAGGPCSSLVLRFVAREPRTTALPTCRCAARWIVGLRVDEGHDE